MINYLIVGRIFAFEVDCGKKTFLYHILFVFEPCEFSYFRITFGSLYEGMNVQCLWPISLVFLMG